MSLCAKFTLAKKRAACYRLSVLDEAPNKRRLDDATLVDHSGFASCRWRLFLFPHAGAATFTRRAGCSACCCRYPRDRDRCASRGRSDIPHRAWNRAGAQQRARQVASRRADLEDQFFRRPRTSTPATCWSRSTRGLIRPLSTRPRRTSSRTRRSWKTRASIWTALPGWP